MYDLQWIVDVERDADHLLKSWLQWKYCICNIHLTPACFLLNKYQEQTSAYINIPCVLDPLFVLAAQLHLEDQHLPVDTEYISRIKRCLVNKEKMCLLLLDLCLSHTFGNLWKKREQITGSETVYFSSPRCC